MRTKKYQVVVGQLNDRQEAPEEFLSTRNALWQKYAAEAMEQGLPYVSCVCTMGYALYHANWGCPDGGEMSAVFSATANPQFIQDMDAYERAVIWISEQIKRDLAQNTINITVSDVDFVYIAG